jgi:hypothetical protein
MQLNLYWLSENVWARTWQCLPTIRLHIAIAAVSSCCVFLSLTSPLIPPLITQRTLWEFQMPNRYGHTRSALITDSHSGGLSAIRISVIKFRNAPNLTAIQIIATILANVTETPWRSLPWKTYNFPCFKYIFDRMFITVFTSAYHWILLRTRLFQSKQSLLK